MGALFLFLLITSVSSAGVALAQTGVLEVVEEAARASRAYAASDFDTAIALYEGLLADGVTDASIYFNLATSYQQAGQSGLALLNYRRAQQRIPRDATLSVRIAEIQGQRQNVQAEETVIIDRLGTIVSPVMTTAELAGLSFIVWLVWFGLATASTLRPNMRVALRPVLIVGGVVTLALVVLLGSRLYVNIYRPSAVVVAERVSVLSCPDERYLELYTLSAAAELRVVAQQESYLRIVLPDGRQGWLLQQGIAFVDG
ncbi:MAG: hypothetical protein AAFV33_08140 [Chloroflexota bacterium]